MEGLVFATLGDVRAGADWHALGRSTGRRAAEHAARRQDARSGSASAREPCSPPPSPRSPCSPACSTDTGRQRQAADAGADPAAGRFDADFDPLYATARVERRYGFVVSTVKNCTANACSSRRSAPEGRRAVRRPQGDAGQGAQGPLHPLSCGARARRRRSVEGARRASTRSRRTSTARSWSRWRTRRSGRDRGEPASRSAADSTAPSSPGKRASTSSRRSATWRCVPSARVRVRPGLAQHLEVMRAGGLRDADVERAAGRLAARGQLAHDRDAHRVAERGHHGRRGSRSSRSGSSKCMFDVHRTTGRHKTHLAHAELVRAEVVRQLVAHRAR